jgi:hypothetical protein
MTDPTEITRLRARVAELELQLATTEKSATPTPPTDARGRHRSRWWAILSSLCLILGCLLAPVSVASVWVHTTLADTDRYVETVAPIAEQPAVQSALADSVTSEVLKSLDIQGLTSRTLTALGELEQMPPRVADALPLLTAPVANGIESFTRDQVERAIASPRFATVWDDANRVAHAQVLRLLEGDESGAVTAQGDSITLDLAPIIAQVRDEMVKAGFTLAQNIPTVQKTFTLVQSDAVTKAQRGYQLLDVLGTWLPFVTLGLIAAGVLLARDRWRALMVGALGVTAGMVLLGVGLAVARTAYVNTTPADILTPEAAAEVFDILVRFLRNTLRAVAVLGLLVALAAFLSGHSTQAARTRAALDRGLARLRRRGTEATGRDLGPFGIWVHAHRRALRITTVSLAAVILLLWSTPTAWVVLWMAVAVAVVLALIQLLATPEVAVPAGAESPSSPAG